MDHRRHRGPLQGRARNTRLVAVSSGAVPGPPSTHPAARIAAVAAGGAAGTAARIGVGELLGPQAFPWATLIVNVVGSAVLGFLAVRLLHHAGTAGVAFGAVGALGAFTTFSAFVAEVDALAGSTATVYIGASLLAGLAAARLGMQAAR